jgi:hypothetical protein
MSYFGFNGWQRHSQRYLDAILMKKAGVNDLKIQEYLTKIEKEEEEDAKKKSPLRRLMWWKNKEEKR